MSPAEVKRSIQHAPQCPKTKKPICWDAACRIGCHRSSCPNAHEPLPKLSKLDYTVATQVLRRGGLRNGPKVNPQEVDGRVAQLRAQAKEEQASKVEPGATAQGKAKAHPKAKAKDKAGWAVPEDYQGPVTQLEGRSWEIWPRGPTTLGISSFVRTPNSPRFKQARTRPSSEKLCIKSSFPVRSLNLCQAAVIISTPTLHLILSRRKCKVDPSNSQKYSPRRLTMDIPNSPKKPKKF